MQICRMPRATMPEYRKEENRNIVTRLSDGFISTVQQICECYTTHFRADRSHFFSSLSIDHGDNAFIALPNGGGGTKLTVALSRLRLVGFLNFQESGRQFSSIVSFRALFRVHFRVHFRAIFSISFLKLRHVSFSRNDFGCFFGRIFGPFFNASELTPRACRNF